MKTFQNYLEESLNVDEEDLFEEKKEIFLPFQLYPVTVIFPKIKVIK